VIGARTLVPLRFIAQSLGATVNWNESASTVTINSGGRGGAPVPPPVQAVTLAYQWPTGTVCNHYPQIRFQVNRPVRVGAFQVLLDGRDIAGGLHSNAQYYLAPSP
jgi:hypothetical protein